MSKVTVISDAKGQILAIAHGHLSEATSRKRGAKEVQGGLRALPGQKLQELELTPDVSNLKNFKDLVEKVRPHLKITA
jgi:hypothetical protein